MGVNKEWVKSEVMDLTNMYHNKPELWDVKSKIYRDRFTEIGFTEIYDAKNLNVTVSHS